MRSLFFLLAIFLMAPSSAQTNSGKFNFEINYGLNGNFFVRSYEERSTPGVSANFYNKNFVGTIGGVELIFNAGKKSKIGLGYSHSINSRVINFSNASAAQRIDLIDFSIRHINNFYQLYYERPVLKKNEDLSFNTGIYYLRSQQQEVDVSPFGLLLEQRNFKNSRLEEAGVFAGLHYSKQIEKRFRIGIRTRLYYTVSTNQLEAITITPTLKYQF